eukprot:1931430-Rhodomonas_salina.1
MTWEELFEATVTETEAARKVEGETRDGGNRYRTPVWPILNRTRVSYKLDTIVGPTALEAPP